jgi:diguanylate cyclase (GGDEF)-like protein
LQHLYESALNALTDQIAIMDSGGDILFVNESWAEFYLCNGGADIEGTVSMGKLLLEKLRQRNSGSNESNRVVRFTVSIGVLSIQPTSSVTYQEFIKQADELLYSAKRSGKDKIAYRKGEIHVEM